MEDRSIHQLSVAVSGANDESGLSFIYRSVLANGLSLNEARHWLRLKSWNALHCNDVIALTWVTGVDQAWLFHRMVISLGAQTPRRFGYLGHEFGEGCVNFTHRARLCPVCIKRGKYAKATWQLRCISVCPEHELYLLERCPRCTGVISWDRPAIDICSCGGFLSALTATPKLPSGILNWTSWIETRVANPEAVVAATSFGLPTVLNNLTIDGAYRLVFAAGFLASTKEAIASATKHAQTSAGMSFVIARGLDRLATIGEEFREIVALAPVIHFPALERMKTHSVAPQDSNCAALLIDCLRQGESNLSSRRGKYQRGQLSLFR